jgi:regulator of nucleoside diphosphate kinase
MRFCHTEPDRDGKPEFPSAGRRSSNCGIEAVAARVEANEAAARDVNERRHPPRNFVMVSNAPITVSERDMRRLSTLLDTSLTYRYPRESARLGEVLAKASVAPDEKVPGTVVTMGATIFCDEVGLYDVGDARDADARPRELALVYPWDADAYQGFVSVLSPMGVALLGLRAGEVAEWTDEDGAPHAIRVIEVIPTRTM